MLKLNKREKNLLGILILMILLLISNLFIISPIDMKISELNNQKQDVLNKKNKLNLLEEFDKENKQRIKDDLILKIEKDAKKIVNIDYLNKIVDWDENNKEIANIELKVNGTLENIFKIEDIIKKLELDNNIEYVEINKIQNNNIEEDSEVKEDIVECMMTLKVVE